jgi:methyl-accepting chemotaxis protein
MKGSSIMKQQGLGSWFKGIKGRLLVVAFFPFIAFAIMFGFTYVGLEKISALVESAHTDIIPNISALDDLRIYENKFGYRMWEGIINPEDRPEVIKESHAALANFKKSYDLYVNSSFDPEEEKLYAVAKADFAAYMTTAEGILANLEKNTPESVALARKVLDEDLHPIGAKLEIFNVKVTDYYDQRTKKEQVEFVESKTHILHLIILVTLCAGFAIMGLLLLTGAKISNTVGNIASNLASSSSRVVEAVEQLSEAGSSLSHNSTESAASLEETVAALEEMSSMVQMNSDNAKQAAALSSSSRDSAERGEAEIKNLIQSMTDISQSSRKIEEIISVIDDIAFQTNLLALNAAVEAARAGEQGKGFAVVAEAVRSLAQRSASSAKDISSLIKTSVEQVERGGKIADHSGEMLSNIVNSIKKVADLNNEIAAASSEQTTGIQQISKAMNQLDQSAQSNAASAEEIAATSDEINNLAHNSQDLTVDLNVAVLGSSSDTTTEPVAKTAAPSKDAKKSKAPSPKAKPVAKVIPLKKPMGFESKKSAEDTIPFDDEPRAKVGTTDGF